MTVSITSVTLEHHRETLGIGDTAPRISWRFAGDAKGWVQSAYEIEISRPNTHAKNFNIIKKSEDSILVPWPTTPLKSRLRASVRVRAFGGVDAQPTEWSSAVEVETGLLEKEDWSAKLVGAERTISTRESLRPALFRKGFKIGKPVKSARLYITSYGVYEAYINGTRVGDHVFAPGWTCYRHRLYYQTFNVTGLLKEGNNAIGVEVAEGWYCGRIGFYGGQRNIYGDQLAVLAQLEVIFEDGETLAVGSDGSWKTSVGPRISSQFYDGEEYDASQEIPGWNSSSFSDGNWKPVEELDFPSAELLSPEGPPIRKTETLKPQKIWKSPTDKVIVDFGQNSVGGVRIRVAGPKGHRITLTHTEVLENDEVATRPLRDCKATDTITLSGEPLEWEPKYTFHGYRYVQVENWPLNHGLPKLSDLEAVVIHSDMEPTGWFECSEPMVNQLHSNIRWGMRGNFVGIPTDCPQRDERLGWTGDIQVFTPTANFLYDTSGFLSSWLKDVSVEQFDHNNIVPQVIPNVLNGCDAQAVWGDVSVITPLALYKSFGDKNFLINQFASMQAWIKAIPRGSNMLWDPNANQLGDWLDPDAPPSDPGAGKTDGHLVANAYLVHITEVSEARSNSQNHRPSSLRSTLPPPQEIEKDTVLTTSPAPVPHLRPPGKTHRSKALLPTSRSRKSRIPKTLHNPLRPSGPGHPNLRLPRSLLPALLLPIPHHLRSRPPSKACTLLPLPHLYRFRRHTLNPSFLDQGRL
jgi:alpha-L-rhamnosidase